MISAVTWQWYVVLFIASMAVMGFVFLAPLILPVRAARIIPDFHTVVEPLMKLIDPLPVRAGRIIPGFYIVLEPLMKLLEPFLELFRIERRKWTRGKHSEEPRNEPSPIQQQKKSVEKDLICPITHSLPYDPVIAEDGRIYEETAWKEYCRRNANSDGQVRSPFTGALVGLKILPAIQQRNLIEISIENGYITGDLVEEWKKQAKEKKKMEDLLKKAEGGDVHSMEKVANAYNRAKYGFKKDRKMAYKWYEKARNAGSVIGMAKVGDMLTTGIGVAQDEQKGMMYLAMAAGMGSEFSAYILAEYCADGRHCFPLDKGIALGLLLKCLSGAYPHKDMDDYTKRKAQQKLDELMNDDGA